MMVYKGKSQTTTDDLGENADHIIYTLKIAYIPKKIVCMGENADHIIEFGVWRYTIFRQTQWCFHRLSRIN